MKENNIKYHFSRGLLVDRRQAVRFSVIKSDIVHELSMLVLQKTHIS